MCYNALMKKLYILVILLLFMVGCDSNYALENIEAATVPETVTIYETVIETQIVEVENTEKIDELEKQLQDKDKQIQSYQDLLGNINELLNNVYKIEASNDGYITGGTGFSIEYNGKYYLITAGHVIDNEYGLFKNAGFKVNGNWVYPKLVAYDTGVSGDYAIFYSDKVKQGFQINTGDSEGIIYLNFNKKIKNMYEMAEDGDSGSPVINSSGEAVGIRIYDTGFYTELKDIIQFLK